MAFTQGSYKIVSKEQLNSKAFSFVIECEEVASMAQTGQFVHIKVAGFSLRRPISICQIDKEKGTIRIVFEIRGQGTEVLSKLEKADTIDMIAPLGKGFTLLEKGKKVVAIGGGIGTPPMLGLAEYYKENCISINGFRNKDAVILEKDFEKTGAKTIICTDDGSYGSKGFVTNELEQVLKTQKPDMIYACGPNGMLKGIVDLAAKNGIECEVSLEERMGCGVGACLVCACKTVKNGEEYYAHVCKDGPVFNSKEVVL